jgi:hypothetical protein
MCYSEKTISEYGVPHPAPTRLGYCMSDNYHECPYYVSHDESGDELSETLGIALKERFYPPIHIIPCSLKSKCPFYVLKPINKDRTRCVALCKATNTYIVKSRVSKCIELWRDCPFYKINMEEA